MKHAWSPQFEAVRVVQLIKIDGFGSSLYEQSDYYVKSTWNVDGYDWEVLVCTLATSTGPQAMRMWCSGLSSSMKPAGST